MEIIQGTIASPIGFHADGKHVGLKRKRKDLGWIYSEEPAQAAAVYTTNQVQAAPIAVTKEAFSESSILSGIIVNSGNANACTGEQGYQAAKTMQEKTAQKMSVPESEIAVASTGVIGEYLDIDTVTDGIEQLNLLNGSPKGFHEAILTTDTTEKELTITEWIDGKLVTMSGVAKGSGMIHPNMATMLGFMTTDAAIDAATLTRLLKTTVHKTFNQITVDGDTSTNDMVIVMANGLAENVPLTEKHPEFAKFSHMFQVIAEHLAKSIARDGEGATKLIEVEVNGATTEEDARMIAKQIVSSSLVKTAMFGGDANWGRIICAIGYSGGRFEPDYITIAIGPYCILDKSVATLYDKGALTGYLAENDTLHIQVDLHKGLEKGLAWGCDLSYDYVKINACYRT
ncbi:bifunctional ornithine acetyltransferase/N-acetylglutamate synthase [Listeria ilorinensis]|uniref:bifunctional ornithine acetyltransferase/N-acetylglutamate synthase n=1 Tax=Listeria ilorinensis TaxID=2867439 RepID=UPI001EF5E1EB|nr:bifunctional ornithine acetyltransferase/N-acetylglutamate synthase [Listeria ilorinensis]